MNLHFPVSDVVKQDTSLIMQAISKRSREINETIASLHIVQRVSLVALSQLALMFGLISIAGSLAAAVAVTTTTISIIAVSTVLAITCAALSILVNPYTSGESMIKNQWKLLFKALKKSNGKEIIYHCQELAKQQISRKSSFNECLGSIETLDVTLFFHKILLVGYAMLAIECLRNNQERKAMENAKMAYSYHEPSGFHENVACLLKAIKDTPLTVKPLIDPMPKENGIFALDFACNAYQKLLG